MGLVGSIHQVIASVRFDGQLTWGDIGGLVAGLAALIGVPLIYWQVLETRRTAQGEALLDLLLRLQEEKTLVARMVLYGLETKGQQSDEELLSIAADVEPVLRLLDLIAQLIYSKKLSREPFVEGDWAGMIARCWKCSEPFVMARRRRENRPDLWRQLQRLGEEAARSTQREEAELVQRETHL